MTLIWMIKKNATFWSLNSKNGTYPKNGSNFVKQLARACIVEPRRFRLRQRKKNNGEKQFNIIFP